MSSVGFSLIFFLGMALFALSVSIVMDFDEEHFTEKSTLLVLTY